MNNDIIAGIVTYNPNPIRLEKNIQSVCKQISRIIIIDNNSNNVSEIEYICNRKNVVIIKNKENFGIAYALNQLMEYAEGAGYKWCLTLDQDSIIADNFVSEAECLLQRKDVAKIVPLLYESSSNMLLYLGTKPDGKKYQEVNKSITSSSITNIAIWKIVGGFDNELFIDYVDYDYDMKIRINKYKLIRINSILLNHQLGESKTIKIGFIKIRVSNHSSFRKYYIARNIVIYIYRYRRYINVFCELLRLVKVIIYVILFENDKIDKIQKIYKGIIDGIEINKYEAHNK